MLEQKIYPKRRFFTDLSTWVNFGVVHLVQKVRKIIGLLICCNLESFKHKIRGAAKIFDLANHLLGIQNKMLFSERVVQLTSFFFLNVNLINHVNNFNKIFGWVQNWIRKVKTKFQAKGTYFSAEKFFAKFSIGWPTTLNFLKIFWWMKRITTT